MNNLRVGDTVFLPASKYPDIVGTVLRIEEDKCLVNFNGANQLYFMVDELRPCIS